MNRKSGKMAGFPKSLRNTPAVVSILCALVLVMIIFRSTRDLGERHRLVRVTGHVHRAQNHHLERVKIRDSVDPPANAMKSLKELVKEAMDRGLVVIVNATDADAERLFADNSHGAKPQWDINGALDGPTGEILAEVIQELRNMEELEKEIAALKAKIKLSGAEGEECPQQRAAPLLKKKTETSLLQGQYKFRPVGQPLHPLVIFSTFRYSPDEFTSVGLAANNLHEKIAGDVAPNACVWMDWDSESSNHTPEFPPPSKKHPRVMFGGRRIIYMTDGAQQGTPYDVALIKCWFEDPVGSNGYGGHLFIKSGGDFILVLSEPPETINRIQFEGPLKHPYAFCAPPIWSQVNAKYLKQWFMYHHHLFHSDNVHYFIYHGIPLDDDTMKVLQPLLDGDMMTLVDLSPEMTIVGGPERFPSHLLALNDCLQRSRFFADWALMWDLNEYLQISPPHNLSSLLQANKNSPYITLGTQMWSTYYCIPPVNETLETVGEPWAIERMFLRLEHPVCGDQNRSSMCVGPEGSRKWIANPRLMYAGNINFPIDPSWGGVDLSTEGARLNRYIGDTYKGFLELDSDLENCKILRSPESLNASVPVDGYWFKDLSFSRTIKSAHTFAKSSPLFNTGFLTVSPSNITRMVGDINVRSSSAGAR